MTKSELLEIALNAAKNAESIIKSYFLGEIETELKDDLTPVTIADKKAEEIIRDTISKAFPDHGFLGEEFGEEKSKSEYQWIIDPIDGTKNFIRKIPIFSTEIALMHNDKVIVGVSNAPALNEILYAEIGNGTYLNNKKVYVSDIDKISEAMVCFGSFKSFAKKYLASGLSFLLEDAKRDRGFGDFYMYHLVTSGRSDIAVEPEIKIWDIAPFKVIIEEAGGLITDMKGREINKDGKSSVVATNKKLHKAALEYFIKL